jgi:hypothetical protein
VIFVQKICVNCIQKAATRFVYWITAYTIINTCLIEQTKHPKRDAVAMTYFCVIHSKKTVLDVFDLIESFDTLLR